jgi:hypothetical protein
MTAVSPFRLSHYGLPASFGIALLAARGWALDTGRRLALAHAGLFAAIALGLALAWTSDGSRLYAAMIDATDATAVKSVASGLPAPVPPFDEFRPVFRINAIVFGAAALATGAAVGFTESSSARRRSLVVFIVTATMIASLPSVAVGLGLVASHRAVRDLARSVARLAGPEDVVAHEGPIENSGALEWYAGRRPVIIDGRRSVLGFGAERPEARDLFWDAARLRRAWASGRRVWVVSVRSPARSVVADLPGARLLGVSGGRSLWVNEIR